MKLDHKNKFLPLGAQLHDVLRSLCFHPQGIVFFVDNKKRLKAVMTDGDVRRALLAGACLEDSAFPHGVKDFVHGHIDAPARQNLELFSDRIKHLPILDSQGKVAEIFSLSDFCRLPVMSPSMGGKELSYILDCVETNWISSQGNYVGRFENAFAEYHGQSSALTTTNGTTALHLALMALGIGPGDEVIVPDLTFGASANTVLHCGARPVFVDVTREYWNLDPLRLEQAITPRTRAIMPVHLYGHPCDMDPIMETADRHSLHVVEDCAEALGARYKGRLVGTIGTVGCFSFFSNKVITTGEGGMVLTKDSDLHDRMALYRDHGMRKERRYWHEVAGFNYRMTNLQAAVGLAQLERIDEFLTRRKSIVETYRKGLANVPGLELPPKMSWAQNIHWLFSILVNGEVARVDRNRLMERLEKENIETRPLFHPLHEQPIFKNVQGGFPVSVELSQKGLSLPSGVHMTKDDVGRVCRAVANGLTGLACYDS